jgi:hypothetical protein
MARLWFDTEFIDTGSSLRLLSIGVVRDDDETYYAEAQGTSVQSASPWVRDNVLPHMARFSRHAREQWPSSPIKPRHEIAQDLIAFAGEKPEWWGYMSAYDWVLVSQLYGPLVRRPEGWPFFAYDVAQFFDQAEMGGAVQDWVALPDQQHHALADAVWTRDLWVRITEHLSEKTRCA